MRVLVVEDSRFTRNMVKKELTALIPDIEIELASDGREGLEKFNESSFDVVLSDLLMPNMQGEEMISKIRASDKRVMVIVLSADVQTAIKEELDQIGIDGFVNKPFNRDKALEIATLIKGASHVE
ncbi:MULTISPECIES: response regulator [unclassified Fusibacter]|uniref:response regulator n=1 Tax=unclassified Fusibacter TaxID=2624464 RepID=UPI0010107325|nr:MULTISPECIES: response regulator [unclassified Fusibacter]MCK8058268.1 response regulator [Fusibacter sp. A2]NPE20851.1 response regulator [Fusibacter sp. A1]RXV63055.1 response regulator [Fusibacter sp. A1]